MPDIRPSDPDASSACRSPAEKFGELLRALRTERGQTQRRLSKLAGISVGHLCELELGKRPPPSPPVFKRLAAALDLTDLQIQGLALPAVAHQITKGLSNHLPVRRRQVIEHVLRSSSELAPRQAMAIQSILNQPSEKGPVKGI